MLNLLLEHWWTTAVVSTLLLAIAVIVFSGTWMIAANQSGLVVKRFGPPLACRGHTWSWFQRHPDSHRSMVPDSEEPVDVLWYRGSRDAHPCVRR